MKTDPEYDNIFDVLFNLNIEIKDYLSTYETNYRVLVPLFNNFQTEVEQKIQQFKDEVFSNIENLKKSIIDEVGKYGFN